MSDETLRCSFCGKTADQVERLIAGPNVYICNECVDLCKDMIDEESKTKLTDKNLKLPKPSEIKKFLD